MFFPKENILVISCMDLLLTDNILSFLNFDNLHNRYDHVILAGASLLCSTKHKDLFVKGITEKICPLEKMMDDQIQIAQGLHGIKDAYIVEHQNCGAYSKFLDSRNKKADFSTVTPEEKCHKLFSGELAQRIVKDYKLNAHCFFIDLRGNVKLLNTFMA